MINGKKILALITARGGSKGVPKKNTKFLNGIPLIAYTIKAGVQSKYIDEVLVTTDDNEIAEAARRYGANVPFLRPAELATDAASSEDTIFHAINWLEVNELKHFDLFVLLQPTSPLRTHIHVDQAIEVFFSKKNVNTLYSVVRVKHIPYKMKRIEPDGSLSNFTNEHKHLKRRQDFPELYHPNGAIYISNTDCFMRLKGFDENRLIPYIMTDEESIDIDNETDFLICEFMLKHKVLV